MWKLVCTIVLGGLGVLLTLATFLPLLRSNQWWIRVLDFPRVQIAVLLVLVSAGWLSLWSPDRLWWDVLLVALAAAVVFQLHLVVPFTPLASKPLPSTQPRTAPDPVHARVRILIANVLMENRDAARLLERVASEAPDVALFVETNAWWVTRLEPLEERLPHTVLRPLDNTYGMAMYSRFPLHDIVVRELTRSDVPSIRTAIEVAPGQRVTFYGVHPPPPWPGEAMVSTPRDVELVRLAREIAEHGGPTIVAGDLNDVAWSRTTSMFRHLSQLLDPRRGRGLHCSFHARFPFARWPLDHVFVSREFSLVEFRRLDTIGSDHFPLFVDVALTNERRTDVADENTREARRLAEAKIRTFRDEVDSSSTH